MPVCTRAAVAGLATALLVAAPPSRPLAARQANALPITLVDHWTWRSLGPPLAGPAMAVAGTTARPNLLYFATRSGGVWQTTDYGQHWQPVGDGVPWGDISALAVADASPNVVYAAATSLPREAGEQGRGALWRSVDAGRSWTASPLGPGQRVEDIAVDSTDASRLWLAVTDQRNDASGAGGLFQSNDGGRSLARTGAPGQATQVIVDPEHASTLYAVVDGAPRRSADGGRTWQAGGRPVPESAPDDTLTLAVGSTATHMLALAIARSGSGVFVSNDAGETWRLVGAAASASEAGLPAPRMALDPEDLAVVFVTNAAGTWRSQDGGRTFRPWLAEPARTAYHGLWINPRDPAIAIVAGDRGATVTVNGGLTWSSRLNQPTGRFRAVVTDNAFPYRVCGTADAGEAVCVDSRPASASSAGWERLGFAGQLAIAPDPLDADVVYGGGVERFDRRTRQFQPVPPPAARGGTAEPPGLLLFSPVDPRLLYFATGVLRTTTNGGLNWSIASPDLTARAPTAGGAPGATNTRPAIVALAPSSVDRRLIWAGSSNGVVQITRTAGTTWTDVSPPGSVAVLSLDASRFDPGTAYAVVRTGVPQRTAALRTRDAGATWADLTSGLPPGATPTVVREDEYRRGLLFAGTSSGVVLSTDDGDSWQPLQLNLPAVPVTDIAIREADLVISTAGRGFWVLDDFSPLRQLTPDVARAAAFLFRPAAAWRTHANRGAAHKGTSATREADAGAAFTYLVGTDSHGPVTLEIIETATGDVIRSFSSQGADAPLTSAPGLHRVVWDLRYTPIDGHGVFVQPGTYQVRLSAGGRIQRQAVVVRMDPRVRASVSDLDAQFTLSRRVAGALEGVTRAVADGTRTSALRALTETGEELGDVLDAVQQADARPAPALVARASAAIDRAHALLESPQP